jgi:hypothetical protein
MNKSYNPPTHWQQIFKPGDFPAYNYVKRDLQINSIKNFVQYGASTILQVTGLSGIGKTVLVKDVIENRLEPIDTWTLVTLESVWFSNSLDGFRKNLCSALELTSKQRTNTTGFNAVLSWFGFEREKSEAFSDEVDEKDILVALNQKVIVIDDFHRLSSNVQIEILQYIRGLANQLNKPNSKITFRFIIIYIPYKMGDLELIRNELSATRIENLPIPLWSESELQEIARVNFRENHLALTNAGMLAKYAYGSPSLMQRLCLEYCLEYYPETIPEVVAIQERHVPDILAKHANILWEQHGGDAFYADITAFGVRDFQSTSRNIKTILDKDKVEGDIYQMVWYILTALGNAEQFANLIKHTPNIEIKINDLQTRLRALTDAPSDIIENIALVIEKISDFNHSNYEKSRNEIAKFSDPTRHIILRPQFDPLFEYIPDHYGNDSRILINSPEFLFALAHSEYHKRKFKRF